jgi:site-specific recombinase XerD
MQSTTYQRFFGLHHIAYLRSVALGVSIDSMAALYFGTENHRQALRAHTLLIAQARALARQHGIKDARLLGMMLGSGSKPPSPTPSIDEWMAEKGYSGFRYDDVMHLYEEAYPPDAQSHRRAALQARQIAVIDQLEDVAVTIPQRADPLDHWFDGPRARVLEAAGCVTLADVDRLIQRQTVWWRKLRGVGRVKAQRLREFFYTLIAPASASVNSIAATWRVILKQALPGELDGARGTNRAPGPRASQRAQNDDAARDQWLDTITTNSAGTREVYAREANRLIMWSHVIKHKPISSLIATDCTEYKDFLAAIPDTWIGPKVNRLGADGQISVRWCPFNSQISIASQQRAMVIVGSWFDWLVNDEYLVKNPWKQLPRDKRVDADAERAETESRAFPRSTWGIIQKHFAENSAEPAIIRAKFVFDFCEATGLRAGEFVDATLDKFAFRETSWEIKLLRKGGSERFVAVPPRAEHALNDYLEARGIPPLDEAVNDSQWHRMPVVAALPAPGLGYANKGIGYHALWSGLKTVLDQVARRDDVGESYKQTLRAATPHWLRHTCGTRSVEDGIPLEVIQQQLGQKSRKSVERYTKAPQESVRAHYSRVFR